MDANGPTTPPPGGEDLTRVSASPDEAATIVSTASPRGAGAELTGGATLGRYRIEAILGIGGMGAVYRATQSKPTRDVALKLIRPGVMSARTLQRFDLEAEILGRLDHRNIARIYEAGVDSATGSPYLAMEYVDGQELSVFVEEHRLSVRDRLTLFVKLCDGIQHAHARGVIHRDLKPGNVIVTPEGEPKVLDFGIACAADGDAASAATRQTSDGQLIGTLYYMSPEQARGDARRLDTRSDVYALGVVLFELLTSSLPYDLEDKALHEAVRTIIEVNPSRLGRFDSSLRGDLEIIAAKALEKDKDDRYQSVAELSADLRRAMADQPILARPPSVVYRASKFVRRNTRLTVAAACITLVFAGAGGFALTQWVSRIEARRLALENVLTALNEMDVQKGLGADLSKRLLDLYSDNGEALFSGDEASLALFYSNLGEAYFGYEDYGRALASYQRALGIVSRKHRSPHPEIATALHKVANAQFYLGDYEQAREHYERTLSMSRQLYRPSDPEAAETASTLDHLGSTLVKLGEHDAALAMYSAARDLRIDLFGPGSIEVAQSNNSIAWFHVQQGQHETAEPIYREALDLLLALPEEDAKPVWVARAMHSLGSTLVHLGRYAEARDMLSESLDLKQTLLSNNKPTVALTLESLAQACLALGEYEHADRHARELLQIREDTADPRAESARTLLATIRSRSGG